MTSKLIKRCTFAVAISIVLCPAVRADATDAFPETPPQAPPLRPASMPAVFSEALDNGINVVVVQSDEVPYLSIRWWLLSGSRCDPAGKEGVASLTAGLLRQGTQSRTDQQIAQVLDFDAITLDGSATHDYTVVSAGCLTDRVETALQVMADVIRNASFPAGEFRRRVNEEISGLSVAERDAGYQADRAFARIVYGDHTMARPSSGTSRSLRSIRVEDVRDFHQMYYAPDNSTLMFSGAIEPARAMELAKRFFGDWERGTPTEIGPGTFPEHRGRRIYVVDRPDSEQSQIRVGHLGIQRTDEAFVVSEVFNQVFGGGFNSRLNKRIRVDEGLTYGARGGMTAGKERGVFSASTFTRTDRTADTVRLLLEEIEKIRDVPPTSEELEEARSFLIGRFGLSLETPDDVARKVWDRLFFGLPADYYASYLTAIEKVTADDVTAFAKAHVHPEDIVVLIVGDAKTIEESLKPLGEVTRYELP